MTTQQTVIPLADMFFTGLNDKLKDVPMPYPIKISDTVSLSQMTTDLIGYSEQGLAQMFINFYNDYYVYLPWIKDNYDSLEQAYIQMRKKMDGVFAVNAPKYASIIYSMVAKYNPLFNYDMKENGIDGSSGRLTSQTTNRGNDTTSVVGNDKTETKVAPYDSATYSNQTEVTSTPATRTYGYGSITVTPNWLDHDESVTNPTTGTKFTNKSVTQHELTRSGNIGVTTTTQMLEQFQEMFKHTFLPELFSDLKKEILLSAFEIY